MKKHTSKLIALVLALCLCLSLSVSAFAAEIDSSGKKSFTGKYTVSAEDYEKLTTLAKRCYSAESEAQRLREENRSLSRQIWSLQSEVSKLRTALRELTER